MRYIKSFANDAAIQAAVDNKTLGKPYVALNDQTGKIDWDSKFVYSERYLTIKATSQGDIVLNTINKLYYSIDAGETWETINGNTVGTIHAKNGDEVMFKGNNTSLNTTTRYTSFSATTATFEVFGNSMSLLYGDSFTGKTSFSGGTRQFLYLFKNCTGLTNASKLVLPAQDLTDWCYGSMFEGCTSITAVPELPATTLANSCYNSMFRNCSNLTKGPNLPADTIPTQGYALMFHNTKLNYLKCLAKNGIDLTNCNGWLGGNVPQTGGTFVKNPDVAENVWRNSGIPSGWTVIEE